MTIYYPQLNTHHTQMQACMHSRIKASSPLDQQLDSHALTTHTYLGIEEIDPYITIQTNGIHTIARRMDDESKTPMLVLR